MKEFLISDENIQNKIYEIRGIQVMFDSDLAEFYECKNGTKDINKAVKRNVERFPEDFYFQLTPMECSRFQIGTLNVKRGQNLKYMPHVFTEQGVAMLASVIHTEVAADISVRIMRNFVAMRHYLSSNSDIYQTLDNINNKIIEHDEKINKLFEQFNRKERLFLSGTVYDAYYYLHSILKEAKNELIIMDPYASLDVLELIKDINSKIILITSNKSDLTEKQINKFNKQYNNKLRVFKNNKFHDRFVILDRNLVYHIGTSINYLGKKVFSIVLQEKGFLKSNLENFIKSIIDK